MRFLCRLEAGRALARRLELSALLYTPPKLADLGARATVLRDELVTARTAADDVRRNRQLNHLVRGLTLPVGLDDLAKRSYNRDAVHQLFDALEFRVLRDRLLETFPIDDAPVERRAVAPPEAG